MITILFFREEDGRAAVVISHGIEKQEAVVPAIEIERARKRRRAFEADPLRHTYTESCEQAPSHHIGRPRNAGP